MRKDILKVIACINVYGISIYGKRYSNIDVGKGNMVSVLRGMSVSRIRKVVGELRGVGLLELERSDQKGLYSMVGDRDIIRMYLKLL